jgi:hypothetical protein
MDRVERPGDAAPGHDAEPAPPAGAGTPGRVALAVGAYVGARLVLLAVLAGVLVLVGLPAVVALLVGVVIALPLSLVLFRGLRTRLAVEVDAATAERRERRQRLRAELRGDA